MVRAGGARAESGVEWDVERGAIEAEKLNGVDAVVHLAGEPIVGRWNAEKKRAIRESRVKGTRLVAEALAHLPRRPRTLVCASAVGWYGDRGGEKLHEASSPGTDFLAGVCREWE